MSKQEIAAVAAQWVVQEGLAYGPAKQRALRQLKLPPRTALPGDDEVEAAVHEHLNLFCADTQPTELRALRELALTWMERLAAFRPHLSGAVWHGTATRHSDICIQLFCDDVKMAEIELINQGIAYKPGSVQGFRGEPVPVLSLLVNCQALNEWVGLHLMVHDLDDVRGALRPDSKKRRPRGDLTAVRAMLNDVVDQ